MEVIRKNFKEALPLVAASVKKADFLVIDTEFTGIINGRDVSMFDTPEEYYKCTQRGSSEFLLIQFGLCAFHWNHKEKHYMNDAYNFYLFPRGSPGPDRMFMCQSSSLDFLASQGFDFNKLIKDGISYMTVPIECKLRENLTERQKTYSKGKDSIKVPDEHKAYVEDICNQVHQFLEEGQLDEMEIDKCNSFVRLLLFQELRARFKDKILVETKILENKNRLLNVKRVKSQDDLKNHDALKKEREWEDFEDAVGFSKVARMISESEKLVVGHNMLLDVMHTLNHFFQPLPAEYTQFKEFTHCMFPHILDTKYMSSLPPFKDKVNSSILKHLLATLSAAPFSLPKVVSDEGRGYSQLHEKHHEAGYDAYVTGLCFLAMHSHLANMRGDDTTRFLSITSPLIKPFLNKVFLSRTAHQDSPFINLAGPEPLPPRDHVFHLAFPREWQRNEITQLFSPFGPITVQFIDDTSAFVALARREQATSVSKALAKHSKITLTSYYKYKKINDTPSSKTATKTAEAANNDCKKTEKTPVRTSALQINATATTPVNKVIIPEKVPRDLSNSVFPITPPRKRTFSTSSGGFEVNELESPTKKLKGASETKKRIDEKIIDRFDSEAKPACVTVFKDDDCWD
ncbi:poly(A)-specific ribonuclease [Bombyx mori]|uniref:Similar to poly(A)-specific ribonuclease, PARN n=1 Tax=Bombyx mori TaxID=7091 RepID=B9X256_BOMMO|nr:poly(A)-specific ribonuclease [Bombyx mori]BAH23570.1 similar to poly(A)-specific ribonuclease, PARN [Bombyx mori]